MTTRLRIMFLAGFVSACGGSVALPDDAGSEGGGHVEPSDDAGHDGASDAAASDAAIDPAPDASCDIAADGCACPTDGVVMCATDRGLQCCGGTWHAFLDGPCRMVDAGTGVPPDCSGDSSLAGCPCETEEEMQCGYFYTWSRVCREGTWVALVGRMCC